MSLAFMQSLDIPGLNDLATFNTKEAWLFLLPLVILTVVAVGQLMLALLVKVRKQPTAISVTADTIISLVGVGLAFISTIWLWLELGRREVSSVSLFGISGNTGLVGKWQSATLSVDYFSLFCTFVILIILTLTTLNLLPMLKRRVAHQPELFPLLTLSATGMIVLAMSRDLVVTFIAIEVVSLPLYVLCGIDESRKSSWEASLKYFLLGAFASGFFIYGAALMYGAAGHLNYAAFTALLSGPGEPSGVFLTGIALVGTGLFFKLAMVPFHAWLPDVYQGAPTPITAFMAAGVKLAVFAATMRLVAMSFLKTDFAGNLQLALDAKYWQDGLLLFAALSMLVGNLFAVHQMSAKRLLAYSAIAHTGYLALGLAACGDAGVSAAAAQSVLFYLVGYAIAAMGAFSLISYLAPEGQDDIYLDELHALAGKAPMLSLAMAILMLSMAGFPLTMGFIGKLLVFGQAWKAGMHGMVIFAVLNSVVGVYYYLRFVLAMYMQPKAPGATELKLSEMHGAYIVASVFAIALTLILGIYPQFVLDLLSGVGLGG